MKKRGQATIFIIIAIILVALAFLVYFLFPDLKIFMSGEELNPNLLMQDCINEFLEENIKLISSQGGSIDPELYLEYNGEKLRYLCYTTEYYRTCVVQEPMLVDSVAKEISDSINNKGQECLKEIKEKYQKKGYNIALGEGNMIVELLPQKIIISFTNDIRLEKGGEVKTYESTKVILDNNLYELLSIANNIISWETQLGDSETTTYMDYYRHLKIEKIKQSDGSKVYIITDRNTGDKFQFASRSLSWPPGYGIESIII